MPPRTCSRERRVLVSLWTLVASHFQLGIIVDHGFVLLISSAQNVIFRAELGAVELNARDAEWIDTLTGNAHTMEVA